MQNLKEKMYLNQEILVMRKTKVICTIGPSSDNEETMRKLIEADARE